MAQPSNATRPLPQHWVTIVALRHRAAQRREGERTYFMDMAFSIVEKSGYRLVTVTGDIDGTNASDFKLACSSARPIVVDLLQCTYIDSVGLHVLIVANRTQELELVLTPSSRIHRIFAITHLLAHFTIVATANEAITRGARRAPYSLRSPLPAPPSAP